MVGRSWLSTTLDLLVATVALSVVWFPLVSTAYSLATGEPATGQVPVTVTSVLALGGAVPFVAGRLSYQSLFRFAVLVVIYLTCAGFIVASVAAGAIADPIPESLGDRAVAVAVAYPLAAFILVNAGNWEPLRGRHSDSDDGE